MSAFLPIFFAIFRSPNGAIELKSINIGRLMLASKLSILWLPFWLKMVGGFITGSVFSSSCLSFYGTSGISSIYIVTFQSGLNIES